MSLTKFKHAQFQTASRNDASVMNTDTQTGASAVEHCYTE